MPNARAKVVFLDDNEDLRDLMPVILEPTLGVECMCFADVTEFTKQSERVLQARVAILDINLGANAADGIDAFTWLKDHGFQGKVVFFTGHARTNPQVAQAEKEGIDVLEKPVHPDKLISFVRRALNNSR